MPHQIEVSDATFARLQGMALPLVDTIETVIEKLADAYDRQRSTQINGVRSSDAVRPREFSTSSPPNLTHAKLLSAKLGGTELRNATWNGLLWAAVRLARGEARTDEELRRLIIVNYVIGRKEDDGYRFLPDLDLSVQGQDANFAWAGAYHIARQLGITIEAEFVWRAKDGAAFPGVTGRLSA